MDEFDNTEWKNAESAREFIDNSDYYILERQRFFSILKSFYNNNLQPNFNDTPINVLDLGCGDGRVTQELLEVDNNLRGTLVDGSALMIKNAKLRLKSGKNLNFLLSTFDALIREDMLSQNYDLIISSLALHHVIDKKALFRYIKDKLSIGGFFVNIDVVRAPSDFLEEWYLTLWKEWITENELNENSNSFIHVPNQYKNNPDNHPDKLRDQLKDLESLGFRNVDCYYKYGIFAMYGGQID